MNPKEEDKGKAPMGSSFSGQSESDAFGSFFEDAAAGISMVSIGFSESLPCEGFSTVNPISSSPAPHLFEFKIEPDFEGDSNPLVTSHFGSDGGIIARRSGTENMDVPQPLECLQGQLVPPFLWKTFDLVDDSALDPIISWGSTGQSFVIWDPVEFSRGVLPSNFKHNNFSSFVRQLNTYGFRKIDTDKWEFANEAFQRGKRHLLKNIQRRKSPHPQQIASLIGPSTEGGKSGLKDEIGRLKKERSMLMEEVVELQKQQRGTVQQVDMVNQRLRSAEQRQKQTISFLAKLLQNPAFVARLWKKKEQKEIDSPRVKRKFIKQHQHEIDESAPSMEGRIVKYQPDWKNLTISSRAPNSNPEIPAHHQQALTGEMGSNTESISFQFETASSSDIIASEDLALHHGSIRTAEELRVEGITSGDPLQVINPDYFISLTEDFPQFSPPGTEGIIKAEEIWSTDFNLNAGMSSSSNELWSNPVCNEDPFLQVSSEFSHIWDLGSLQAGGSGVDKWSADEFAFDEPDNQTYPKKDNDS